MTNSKEYDMMDLRKAFLQRREMCGMARVVAIGHQDFQVLNALWTFDIIEQMFDFVSAAGRRTVLAGADRGAVGSMG